MLTNNMKPFWRIIGGLISIFSIVIFAGCETPTNTSSPANPAQPKLEESQNRNGLTLREAEDKAVKLQPGLTQDEILLLLGKPDETSAGTYGTKTPKPWNGISWYYRWGKIDSLQPNYKQLTIVFEDSTGAWVVNSWLWSGQTPP